MTHCSIVPYFKQQFFTHAMILLLIIKKKFISFHISVFTLFLFFLLSVVLLVVMDIINFNVRFATGS